MKNILKYILAISLCFCLSVPALATFENPSGTSYNYVTASGGTGTTNYWTAVTNSLYVIGIDINNMYNDLHSSTSYLNTIKSDVASIKSSLSGGSSSSGPSGSNYSQYNGTSSSTSTSNYWSATTNSLRYIGLDTYSINNKLNSLSNIENSIGNSSSTGNNVIGLLKSLKSYFSDLHDIFANQTDLNLRNNQNSNIQEATTDFFSGSASSTSIGTGTIRSIKGSFGDAQSFFGMGEGVDIFGVLTDDSSDGPWQWFTQAVKDDISTVQQSRDEVYIDFLSPKNEDLLSRLGGEDDDTR